MKKKKIIKYLVLLAAILFAAYIAVHIALSKYISNRVHKAGFDFKVEISSIVLSPFKGGFTLKSINIDDKLLLKNVLIKINFKNFFKNSAVSDEQKEQINENQSAVFNYLKYIKQINIKTAQISFDANGSIKDKAQEILDNLFTPQELYITIDNLSFDGLSDIYFSAFVLRFGENQSSLSSNASVLGQNIKILYEISPGNKNLLDSSLIISANDELEVYTLLKGVINKSSLSLNHSVVIEYLGYKDFRISKAQGSLIGSIEDLNFNLSGEFGSLNLASKNFKDFTVNADIKSSKINENIKADFKADYFYSGGLWKLSLSSNKVSLYSADFGKMDINIVKDANGVYKADYKYGLNNEARLNIIKDSLFDLKLFVGKKYAGGIYINKNLGLIKSDIFNIKAADFPLNPFWGYNSKGTVSITGSVNKQTGGVIYLTVSQFKTDLIAPTNISGIMTMKDEEYVLDISDDLGFISFDARVKDLKFLLADFKFKGVRISKIAQILHYKDNVFWGFMQGNIFYERGKSLSFDIKSSSGVFYGNRFKDFVLKASQNADKIELEEFSMKDLKGANLIKVSGNLFWTDKNQYSNVDIKADGFKIKDFVLSSQIGFLGKLTQSGAIEGVVKDAYIKVNGTLFDSLQADAVISKKSVNISDIDSANGLRADFKYDFEKDLLSATMRFKNSE
ncbi:MAG: hypothetical protein LBT79_00640, partial [Elusimicrobiota bacterium]|nr:hypothetical protein [Elusimicrobiota bacterium]